MATSNPANIARVPGRITVGGTAIGVTKDVRFLPNEIYEPLTAEEFGHSIYKVFSITRAPKLICVLRSWDAAAVSAVFPTIPVGDLNPKTASDMTGKEAEVRFIALNATDPSIRLYRAVPMIADTAQMNLGYNSDIGLTLVFTALPDSSGRFYNIGAGV